MNKEQVVAKEILALLGGQDNISAIEHCATRLRIVLKDDSILTENAKKVEDIEGVKGQFYANKQYQVILGTGFVNKVYAEIMNLDVNSDNVKSSSYDNLNIGQKMTRTVADVFLPIIPVLVAAGLFLGLNGFVSELLKIDGIELASNWNTLLTVLNATAFIYLPALVVWSVVKRLGGRPAVGIILGLMLISPMIPNAWDVASGTATPLLFDFGLFELGVVGFQGAILPAIAVGIFAALVEKGLKKIVPDILDLILTPFLTLLVSLAAGLFILGPSLHIVEAGVLTAFEYFLTLPYGIGGFIVGALNQIIVVTGMHHIFIGIETGLINATGANPWNAMMTGSLAAQGAAALAVGVKLRNKKKKALAISSAVPAFLGITEPAIFGVNLTRVRPFVCAVIAGGVAGALASILGLAANSLALTVIPGTLLYIGTGMIPQYIIVNLVGAGLAFILTLIFYKDTESA